MLTAFRRSVHRSPRRIHAQQSRDGMLCTGEFQAGIVAIKIAEVTVPRARARTHLTEVKVASSLTHPNVVRPQHIPVGRAPAIVFRHSASHVVSWKRS